MAVEFRPTAIGGVGELVSSVFTDHRGAFLNGFRRQEAGFAEAWGDRPIAQVNLSCTRVVGAVRGLHLQKPPHGEAKLVRCLRGRVLVADSELLYLQSGAWLPEAETGVRFNDPQLAINWPLAPVGLSGRDLELPLLELLR